MITKIIIFHESGVPIYTWPEEGEKTSIFTSFFSAIQQFANTYFSQNVNLIGMENENILFLKHGEYILAMSFIDLSQAVLVEKISSKILSEISPLLARELEELQFDSEQLSSQLRGALTKSGFFWLYEIASYVVQRENVMGISIFEVDDNNIQPLYYPLKPYLGFEKVMRCVALCMRYQMMLRQNGMEALKLTFLAKNGNCIQVWFFEKMSAILEYHFDKSYYVKVDKAVDRSNEVKVDIVKQDPFLELIFSLSIDILGDLPAYCQMNTLMGNILIDCTGADIHAYEIPLEFDITNI